MVRSLSRESKSPVPVSACVGRAILLDLVCGEACGGTCCSASACGGACCSVSVLGREQAQRTETRTNGKPNHERSMSSGLGILVSFVDLRPIRASLMVPPSLESQVSTRIRRVYE